MESARDRPGLHGAAREHRSWPNWLTLFVLGAGVAITAVLSTAAFVAYYHNETRLLNLQTRLTVDAGERENSLYVETHLGTAAKLAALATDANTTFLEALNGAVGGSGLFVDASLWHLRSNGSAQEVTSLGPSPLASGARRDAIFNLARSTPTFTVTKLAGPGLARLGYAAVAQGAKGVYVAYAEEALPADRHLSTRDSPLAGLNLAVYLGRKQTTANLLEANSTAPLPLRGRVDTTTVPFGMSVITVTTSPRGSLAGGLAQFVPFGVIIVGLFVTLTVGYIVERLVRRRQRAEELTSEIGHRYVEQRSIAETLQRALLPEQLPSIPGMQIAVRYLPGVDGVDVGGDWYDVVPLDEHRFIFIVGDVSGRGLRAAAVMASLRFAGRGFSLEGHSPDEVLEQLAKTVNVVRDGHFATVLCGLVDVEAHSVTIASAGHLPPVLASAGKVEVIPVEPSSPIGIAHRESARSTTFSVGRRATLVAYTDGLVERRNESLDTGIARLTAALQHGARSLDEQLNDIIAELTEGSPADDVALVGLRWLN